jgi:FkbM family methyltransferase
MRFEQNKVWVQIGTADGVDEFSNLAMSAKPSMIILVEPNKDLNPSILNQYRDMKNVFIENVAITECTKGKVKLVHPDNDPNATFYNECFSLLPMDDWGDKLKVFEVESMSFMDLCKKYGLKEIYFLQIDTEGYDAEIIKSIDFNEIAIDILKYERWDFPVNCFKRHGEKGKQYGINGMAHIAQLLENLGYTLEVQTADIIATKNEW